MKFVDPAQVLPEFRSAYAPLEAHKHVLKSHRVVERVTHHAPPSP